MILIFFLEKRRLVQFLARIANYYRVLVWLFLHIICVIFKHFPLFWHFLDVNCHYTQIEPFYRPLFWILKPMIIVFLRVVFYIREEFFRLDFLFFSKIISRSVKNKKKLYVWFVVFLKIQNSFMRIGKFWFNFLMNLYFFLYF